MRPVTAALFSSIDGAVESPHHFQFDHFDADMGGLMTQALSGADAVVMGRRTYDEWSQYWPANTDDGFGDFINPIRKYVASSTLTDPLAWQNSTIIPGDAVDFVRELKQTEGAGIVVTGSISLVRQLLLAGVLDRLTLMVHPVVAGAGLRHLFDPDEKTTRLELVDHTVTVSGNAILTYALRS